MSGLSRECRTCCRKSRIKFSRQTKKQARIFQARKYEVHIFQQEASLFPAWPASTFPSGASRPIPPATILSIPAPQSSISQLPSSRLGRPTPYITSHHFFNIYKAPSSPTYSRRISAISTSPFHSSTHLPFSIFYIAVNILPVFAFPYLHLTTFPMPSTSSVLLPLLQPAGQTRNVVSRAGAACKAADGAGEEPAFLFFLSFFYFFLLLSFLSPFPSPWRRGFAATPSLFFSFLSFFFSFLFFSFLLFSFIFLFLLPSFFIFLLPLFFLFSPASNLFYAHHFFLFCFSYPSHSNLFPVHRQPLAGHSSFFFFSSFFIPLLYSPALFSLPSVSHFFFFFLLFFLSSTIFPTLSSSPPAAVKRRKKIGKRILRERDGLPGENGQREERQRDGMEPRGGGMEGVRKRCILCGKE